MRCAPGACQISVSRGNPEPREASGRKSCCDSSAITLYCGKCRGPLAERGSRTFTRRLQGELHTREKYFEAKDRSAPEFTLQDGAGKQYRLADLHDKVVVLHFIYVGCNDVCPLHAEKIAEIQRLVNITPMRDEVQFLTITTDPGRDTPDVLRTFGEDRGLQPPNWAFLTTMPGMPEDATRKLAEQFGHKFTKTADGMQMHGVVTHVIDREGRLRANFHGLQFEPTNLLVYVTALVNDRDRHGEERKPSLWERLRARF